jgi:hypothetical protein
MLHPFARMDITGMHRMPARRTAITARVGLRAESLSELDRGSTGSVEATGAVRASAAEAVLADADLKDAVGLLHGVERLVEDPLAADSMAVAPGHSTVEAASTVAVAVSTAVAEAMAAVGTGN